MCESRTQAIMHQLPPVRPCHKELWLVIVFSSALSFGSVRAADWEYNPLTDSVELAPYGEEAGILGAPGYKSGWQYGLSFRAQATLTTHSERWKRLMISFTWMRWHELSKHSFRLSAHQTRMEQTSPRTVRRKPRWA
jgi:hypothetical protein